jgi:hypothetical protein
MHYFSFKNYPGLHVRQLLVLGPSHVKQIELQF